MRLQQKTDYALRCVLHLAAKSPESVCVSELAQAVATPEAVTKKLVTELCKAGLVATCSGPGGGVSLAKHPGSVSVYDVVRCIEGELCLNRCLGPDGACSRKGAPGCGVHQYLLALQSDVVRSMQEMTFDRLLQMDSLASPYPHSFCLAGERGLIKTGWQAETPLFSAES